MFQIRTLYMPDNAVAAESGDLHPSSFHTDINFVRDIEICLL
jgi:hypothetical protein